MPAYRLPIDTTYLFGPGETFEFMFSRGQCGHFIPHLDGFKFIMFIRSNCNHCASLHSPWHSIKIVYKSFGLKVLLSGRCGNKSSKRVVLAYDLMKLPSSVQTETGQMMLCVTERVPVMFLCLFFHCLCVLGASQRTLLMLFTVTLRSTFPLLCYIPDCFDFSSDAEYSLTGRHAPQDPAANHEPGGRGSLTVTHEGRQRGGVRSWRRGFFPLDSPSGLASFRAPQLSQNAPPQNPCESCWPLVWRIRVNREDVTENPGINTSESHSFSLSKSFLQNCFCWLTLLKVYFHYCSWNLSSSHTRLWKGFYADMKLSCIHFRNVMH